MQEAKEAPSAYKTHLYEQIELHSGYNNLRDVPEHFFNTMFVEGLCDEVRRDVKARYPVWKNARTENLHDRARQAWKTMQKEERRGRLTQRALVVRDLERKDREYEETGFRP